MNKDFFSPPTLDSPYEDPGRHWELDGSGQPTNVIKALGRPAEFITPIPKLKKKHAPKQRELELTEGEDFKADSLQYAHTQLINELRRQVDDSRTWPDPNSWKVIPETARLLQHWRQHDFQGIRPFFWQIESQFWSLCAPLLGNVDLNCRDKDFRSLATSNGKGNSCGNTEHPGS